MTQLVVDLNLKKRLSMRGYQETVVVDIIDKFGLNKPYVLGSCPGSGKTEMAIEATIRLIESGFVDKVLILAHSTNVLKENFYQRLCEYFHEGIDIDVMRGQKNYNYNARIQVMIPQNIVHVIGKFDLIIVDEAQHNVLAEDGNYSRIVEMVEPKFQLLLTGTPSKFILENNIATNDGIDLPYHINTIGMDMVGFEHFHNVRFDLIKSAYGFTSEDYNRTMNISDDINFSFEETERTVNNVIIGAVRNIALRSGIVLPKDSDFIMEGRKLIQDGKFGKTLIMCRSIEQANQISSIISKLFEVKVRVSQSKNDTDSSNLDKFKRNQFEFLCVVNRAREGYDDNKVVNLIDITMTHNIDLIYQMFCRVVRLDKSNPNPKLYIKVTSNSEGMPEYTMNIMTAALMLGATENLSVFNGRNFRGLVMPRIEREDEDEDDVSVDGVIDIVSPEGDVVRRRRINDLMALDLIQMFSEDNENLIHGNDRYAMTTLGESLKKLEGDDFYIDKGGYFNLIRNENISIDGWREGYKTLSERDNIKYHSNPWRFFGQTPKEFFDECWGRNYDKEFYYKLMIDNKISGGRIWTNEYVKLSERDNAKYHSKPWVFFGQSEKDFFVECWGEPFKDKNGYFKLIIEQKILSTSDWQNKYKELSNLNNIRYHSNPWTLFKQSGTSFFEECYPNKYKIFNNKEGYFKLIINENITSGGWLKKYKILSERDGIRYHSSPWRLFSLTADEFFKECYPDKQEFFNNKDGYINLIRKEKITSNQKWLQEYKKLSKRDELKYHSAPWSLFDLKLKDFFKECYPDKQEVYDDKNGYFKLLRKETNILSSHAWAEVYKKLSERDGIRYNSNPWRFFGQSPKEFFDEYKQWLKDNPEPTREYHPAYLGEFSDMNKKWNTTNSKENHKRLNTDPTEWFKYHKLYSSSRKKWNEIPYIELSKKIKDRPDWIVGDFGCGENLLAKEIKNKVYSFDHVSIDDSVKSCDLTDVPLHNNVLDVVVFSLSLMGTNYKEYFDEAYRVLKPMGVVFIAEPQSRWEDREDELRGMLEKSGFKVTGDVKYSDRFIYVDAIKY